MQSHFQGWSFWHLYWRILDHLGVDIVKSVKVFQLHKLTIDCHAGRGDGSRISHLKLSYQILHEILSSLVPGVLDFHKCPLLCGVMRPNHLFFPRLHRSNIIGTPLGAVFLESFTNSDNLSQMKPWSMVVVTEKKEGYEWNITVNHTQALFLLWKMNYWILCSLSVLERYYCAGKHRLGLGCRAMSLQQRRQCLSSTSDGCGEICVFAYAFIAFLG